MKPTISLREIIDRRCEREYGARYRSVLVMRGLTQPAVRYVYTGREWEAIRCKR